MSLENLRETMKQAGIKTIKSKMISINSDSSDEAKSEVLKR